MKISIFLILALAFVVLQVFSTGSDAATRRLSKNSRKVQAALRTKYGASTAQQYRRAALLRKRQKQQVQLARSARARSQSVRPRSPFSRTRSKASRTRSQASRARTTSLRSRTSASRRRPSRVQQTRLRRGKKVSSSNRRTSSSLRRNNRNYRRKSASRRRTGRRTASPSLRRLRYLRRRGRQEAEASENDIEEEVEPLSMDELMEMVEEGPENEVEAEAMADAIAEAMEDEEMKEVIDANGDGVPDWCNPTKPMGAWLNFKNMRLWCAGKGWTKFGPYGGVPSQDEPEEEVEGNELDLLEEEELEPLEEEEGLLEDQEE